METTEIADLRAVALKESTASRMPVLAARRDHNRNRLKASPYVVAVDAGALALLIATLPDLPSAPWIDLMVFVGIATLMELWTMPTTVEGEVSLSLTVYYAAAVLFGPCFGALTALAACLLAEGVIRRKGVFRTAFNMGQFALIAGLAGLTFGALSVGPQLDLTADAPAYAASAAVLLALNIALPWGLTVVLGNRLGGRWLLPPVEIGLFYVAMAPLGVLMANAYQQSAWAMLYFPLLLVIIYMGFRLFANLRAETDKALVVLADTIDKRDRYTSQHSVRVAAYVAAMTARLDLPAKQADLIVSAARVHDLGKISVDNRILHKEGSLTDKERRLVEAHPVDGAKLAGQFSMYRKGRELIRHHHERWDGCGYPDGLAAESIPLGARIIAVADAYDAMTSDRPYRDALAPQVARDELQRGSARQFDARMVEVFLALEGSPATSTEACASSTSSGQTTASDLVNSSE